MKKIAASKESFKELTLNRPPYKSACLENNFLIFHPKHHVKCTQKNRLIEKVLLSTQNICLNKWIKKITVLHLKSMLT